MEVFVKKEKLAMWKSLNHLKKEIKRNSSMEVSIFFSGRETHFDKLSAECSTNTCNVSISYAKQGN